MNGDYNKVYGQIVAKAWSDDAFREQLLRDPATVLRDNGIDVPEGVEVTVVELPSLVTGQDWEHVPVTTPNQFVLALPARPTTISDEELARVAGGAHWADPTQCTVMCACHFHVP